MDISSSTSSSHKHSTLKIVLRLLLFIASHKFVYSLLFLLVRLPKEIFLCISLLGYLRHRPEKVMRKLKLPH